MTKLTRYTAISILSFIAVFAVLVPVAEASGGVQGDMLRLFGMDRVYYSGKYIPDCKDGLKVGGTLISSTTSAYLTGITPGTVTASKAVVVDSSKNAGTFNRITATDLYADSSVNVGSATGGAGTISITPSDSAKGAAQITCTNNAGATITSIVIGAQQSTRTYGLPDWSTKASADTEASLAGIKVVADTTSRPGALGCLLFATGNSKLYICTTASATAATWTIVGSQS